MLYDRGVNYEFHMGAALAEARAGADRGDRAHGSAATLDDVLVARAHDQVRTTGDPTAHAVLNVVREAARRLGQERLSGVTVFATHEPCMMCLGALLECDVDNLVYALSDPGTGAVGRSQAAGYGRRLHVVSGIMQAEAADLRRAPAGRGR